MYVFTGAPKPARQQGAVLIVSLILLVVLTVMGMAVMNTTQLEEKMASNMQESTRSFQTAETGLSQAFDDNDFYDLNGHEETEAPMLTGDDNTVELVGVFMGWSPPPAHTLYSATSFQAAHFDITSTGKTKSAISTTLHGGAYQIAPKNE